jgi:CRP-like cAMP-binding protein
MQYRNGVFIITEEKRCPIYNAGEELRVNKGILTLPVGKPTCLTLTRDLIVIVTEDVPYERYRRGEIERFRFECGGCTGLISFEFKRDKGYATLQMKMLAARDRREKTRGIVQFADLLRPIEIFAPLTYDNLLDIATLFTFTPYPGGFPIVQKGEPGTLLYIIISGRVEILDDDGVTLAELTQGDVLGEMSLLSGEAAMTTIVATEPCHIATLKSKDFRHILTKFPVLQDYFYKLLVSRITRINLQRAEELSSGMVGQFDDISVVELCQMINANLKTGRLKLEFGTTRACIDFREGEIIHAEFNGSTGPDAFFQILGRSEGRFKFINGLKPADMERDVLGGFMALLMQGMKRLDDLEGRED